MRKQRAPVCYGGRKKRRKQLPERMRNPMNFRLGTAAAGILAASLVVSYAHASDATPPAKKHAAARKAATPPGPTVQEQIESLRQ